MAKAKLKVAYIIPRFHPFKGGAEESMMATAKRMAKLGHDVTVLTTNVKFRDEKLPKEEVFEGMKIIRNWAPNEMLYAGFYPKLLPHLLRTNYDVIHSSGIGFAWAEFCMILSKKYKNKEALFINTPHGPFMTVDNHKGIRKIIKKVYDRVLRIYLNWLYDAMIAVNPKQSEWMGKTYGMIENKIYVIPNGIEKDYIEKAIYEKKFNDKNTVISFIGRLERYKGPHQVVKALGKLERSKKNLPDFEFWILGRPSASGYKEYMQDLVKKEKLEQKVKFIFSPTDEERDDALYKHSQVHILPSQWEATGIVLIEAMAKGNAVITTYQNEACDLLIENGKNGFIYENEDIDQLSKILELLIIDVNLQKKMAKLNLEKAKTLTWDSSFKKYQKILDENING